jgi:hypothetical protein
MLAPVQSSWLLHRNIFPSRTVAPEKSDRLQNEVVTPSIVLTHRDRTLTGHDHERAGADALRVERIAIHEVLYEERQLSYLTARSPEVAACRPQVAGRESGADPKPPRLGKRGPDESADELSLRRAPILAQMGEIPQKARKQCRIVDDGYTLS